MSKTLIFKRCVFLLQIPWEEKTLKDPSVEVVAPRGFEPQTYDPKSYVLPITP